MKHTKILCAVTSMLIAVLLVALSVSAPIAALDTLTTSNLNKIDSTLQEKMATMNDSSKVFVSVWFEDIDYKEVKRQVEEMINDNTRTVAVSQKAIDLAFYDVENTINNRELTANVLCDTYSEVTTEEIKAVVEAERAVVSTMYQNYNQSIVNAISENVTVSNNLNTRNSNEESLQIEYVCRYAPNVDMYLTKEQIISVAENDYVTEIYYVDTSNENNLRQGVIDDNYEEDDEPYDMTFFNVTGLATARDVWGLAGQGMNVGMVEIDGPPSNFTTLGTMTNVYMSSNNLAPQLHAGLVASIMIATSYKSDGTLMFKGAIPNANLFTAAITAENYIKPAIEALLDSNVTAINCSFSYPEETPVFNLYGDTAKWYDHISVQHNVHLILSSSNYGSSGVKPTNTSYNAIVVGACNNEGVILSNSSYINSSGFMNKPDIVAPGKDIKAPVYGYSGTSFAAPMVTSAVVQLSQASPILMSNPTLMKAVLLSSSKITDSMSIDTDVFSDANGTESAISQIYGAGLLNVAKAYSAFVDNGYYKTGTMSPYSQSVIYTKNISRVSGKTLRVCLTWNKMNTVAEPHETGNVSSGTLDNFKLTVTTPSGVVYSSQNLYDNKQMISFVASENGTYTFKISRFGTGSSNEIVRYSLGYSVQS